MKLTLDIGVGRDFSGEEISVLDRALRRVIPELVGWSYSPLTGELTLDFGDVDENVVLARIEDYKAKAKAVKVLRFEFMELVKEW